MLFKWEGINYKFKILPQEKGAYNNPWWSDQSERIKDEIYGYILVVFVGFFVLTKYSGRRMKMTFFLLIL
jgi:protein involved in sex pheromone biosynthesis